MLATFALVFIALAIIIGIVLFVLGKGDKPGAQKSGGVAHKERPSTIDRSNGGSSSVGEEWKSLIESYPGIKGIVYFPVPEGCALKGLKEIDNNVRETIEAGTARVKPISGTSIRLMNLLRSPESSSPEISNIVLTNPMLSGRLLQAVNSAYFGLSEKITSVGRAITLLGYNNVRSVVCQEALNGVVPKERLRDKETYAMTWVHSAVVSTCAGYLGKELFRLPVYDLATMGLLHDIGKYFIDILARSQSAPSELPSVVREERERGANHAVLGGLITAKWQLSDSIVASIEFHHHPTFVPPQSIPTGCLKQSFVICVSDLISKLLGYPGQDQEVLPIRKEYYEMFRIDPDPAALITPALLKEIEKARATVESYAE